MMKIALDSYVHIADSFNHRASSGLRYIVNPREAQDTGTVSVSAQKG
jgi:hypothetical protein